MRLGLGHGCAGIASILVISLSCACSGGSSSASSEARGGHDAATAAARVETVEVPAPLPLGAGSLDAFGYRRGPGRSAYERAVKAEKLARGDDDWQTVVDACREALAADPDHLDASWLLAAALARLGRHAEILGPLSRAIAGDWAKWGERSLVLPLFEEFLASPYGEAWRALAEQYRAAFGAAARRALIVLGRDGRPRGDGSLDRRTEVYGWDATTGRWLRLTRTGGTVVAVLPGPAGSGVVAYVAYRDLVRPGDRTQALARPRVAVLDLGLGLATGLGAGAGRTSREVPFTDVSELQLSWRVAKAGDEPQLVVAARGGKEAGTWLLDWKRGQRKKPPAKPKLRIGHDAVIVARGQVQRRRVPVDGITADWDDDGLASAIRLDATRKTVTPPAGWMVDGNALVWSPDDARLAMVAQVEDDCDAAATLFVVDAGTGKLRELGRAAAPAPTWVDATHLAYTDGDRVRLVDVTSAAPTGELTSAGGVATAIVDRPCAAPDDEALFAPAPDDPGVVEEPELTGLGEGDGEGDGDGDDGAAAPDAAAK